MFEGNEGLNCASRACRGNEPVVLWTCLFLFHLNDCLTHCIMAFPFGYALISICYYE